MGNPVFVDCTKNEWALVATDVTSGVIHKTTAIASRYLQTYKLTGEAAPTLKADGVRIFDDGLDEIIASSVGIDVYIFVVGEVNGRVRVDI